MLTVLVRYGSGNGNRFVRPGFSLNARLVHFDVRVVQSDPFITPYGCEVGIVLDGWNPKESRFIFSSGGPSPILGITNSPYHMIQKDILQLNQIY